jgi:hypothetical protein
MPAGRLGPQGERVRADRAGGDAAKRKSGYSFGGGPAVFARFLWGEAGLGGGELFTMIMAE